VPGLAAAAAAARGAAPYLLEGALVPPVDVEVLADAAAEAAAAAAAATAATTEDDLDAAVTVRDAFELVK
jgi:hypothetical protein